MESHRLFIYTTTLLLSSWLSAMLTGFILGGWIHLLLPVALLTFARALRRTDQGPLPESPEGSSPSRPENNANI